MASRFRAAAGRIAEKGIWRTTGVFGATTPPAAGTSLDSATRGTWGSSGVVRPDASLLNGGVAEVAIVDASGGLAVAFAWLMVGALVGVNGLVVPVGGILWWGWRCREWFERLITSEWRHRGTLVRWPCWSWSTLCAGA